ncbi:MAG: hypothetical protein KDI90_00705 [Alphaproteobacteria bacterium]|nr:hypothetical protein [Alphaproteobacteria bacterium]MCB9975534.1 hypothetical protein [Rhodospirillales bacterium]
MALEYDGSVSAPDTDGEHVQKVRYRDPDTGDAMDLTYEQNEALLHADIGTLRELNIARSTVIQGRDAFPIEVIRAAERSISYDEPDVAPVAHLDF